MLVPNNFDVVGYTHGSPDGKGKGKMAVEFKSASAEGGRIWNYVKVKTFFLRFATCIGHVCRCCYRTDYRGQQFKSDDYADCLFNWGRFIDVRDCDAASSVA